MLQFLLHCTFVAANERQAIQIETHCPWGNFLCDRLLRNRFASSYRLSAR